MSNIYCMRPWGNDPKWRATVLLMVILLCVSSVFANTPNFTGSDGEYTAKAEESRRDIAVFWSGKDLPKWSSPCQMSVTLYGPFQSSWSGGGATSFRFDRGEVSGWNMSIQGNQSDLIDSVIPHEVCHTVLASMKRQQSPRWIDEGACSLFESPSSHSYLRSEAKRLQNSPYNAFRRFDEMEYPQSNSETGYEISALYATGFSVTEWMLEREGKKTLSKFIVDERLPSQKFEEYYGMTPQVAEQEWLAWINGHPSSECRTCNCFLHFARKKPIPKTTLIDFSATWCGPCKTMQPIVDKLKKEGLPVIQIDIDKNPEKMREFSVTGIPTFVMLVEGKEVGRIVGATSEGSLRALLDKSPSKKYVREPKRTGKPPIPPVDSPKPVDLNDEDWSGVNVYIPVSDRVPKMLGLIVPRIEGLAKELTGGKANIHVLMHGDDDEVFYTFTSIAGVDPNALIQVVVTVPKNRVGLVKGLIVKKIEGKILAKLDGIALPIEVIFERENKHRYANTIEAGSQAVSKSKPRSMKDDFTLAIAAQFDHSRKILAEKAEAEMNEKKQMKSILVVILGLLSYIVSHLTGSSLRGWLAKRAAMKVLGKTAAVKVQVTKKPTPKSVKKKLPAKKPVKKKTKRVTKKGKS